MKKTLILLLALGLLVACSDNNEPDDLIVDSYIRTETVTISPIITRATETDFEEGDVIGLTMVSEGEIYARNAQLTYDGEIFSGELEWYSGDAAADFSAYYPYSASGAPTSFTVASDQGAEGAYEASDLLLSYKSGVTESYSTRAVTRDVGFSEMYASPVTMTFSHKLSKILFSFSNSTSSSISSVVLQGSVPTCAVDIENLTVTASESASAADIKAQQVTETTFRAIVIPQDVQFTLVVTLSDGSSYEAALTEAALVSGGQYGVSASLDASGLTVNLSDEYSDWTDEDVTVILPKSDLEEHLDENYIIYHDEVYKTVTLSNGTTWMAQNMRYLPEGYTPTDDPTSTDAHVWYPYKLDYDQASADGNLKVNLDTQYTVVLTDESSIEENGYLYDLSVVFGEEITADNYREFEDAQGICPNGWHIPNRAEWFDLVGASNKNMGESSNPANYTEAVLWDSDAGYATIPNAVEQFGFTLSGAIVSSKYQTTVCWSGNTTLEDYYGKNALSYIWSSTCYTTNTSGVPQFFAGMTSFTSAGYPKGRISLAYSIWSNGMPLRCVRDSGIDFYEKHSNLVRPSDYQE